MNAKANGTRNEHRIIEILEATGSSCPKTDASLGLFNVMAISCHGVRLVQVKSTRLPCPAEREAIELFEAPANATKELWLFRSGQRPPNITIVG